MMPPSKPAPGSQRLLAGLLIVLAAWGIYLAIGATGIFTDVGLFDARRSAIVLACSAAFGSAFVAAQGLTAGESTDAGGETVAPPKRPARQYPMKKSINLWALPYPQKLSLRQCFRLCKDAGFDAGTPSTRPGSKTI